MQAGVSDVALVVRGLERDPAAEGGLESGGPRSVVVVAEIDNRSRGVDAELERRVGHTHSGGISGIIIGGIPVRVEAPHVRRPRAIGIGSGGVSDVVVQQHVGTFRRCAARGGRRAGCIRERRHVPEVVHGHGDRAVGVMAGALGRQAARARAHGRLQVRPDLDAHVVAADALRVVVAFDQPVVLATGGVEFARDPNGGVDPALLAAVPVRDDDRSLGRTHHVDVGLGQIVLVQDIAILTGRGDFDDLRGVHAHAVELGCEGRTFHIRHGLPAEVHGHG